MYNICYVIRNSRNSVLTNSQLRSCKSCGDKIIAFPEIAQFAKQYNLKRRIQCLLCPAETPEFDIYETWEDHIGADATYICDVSERPAPIPPALYKGGSVMAQIERNLPVEEISGWPSAMAQLRYELAETTDHKSVTAFMSKHRYRMCDAIRLGLTFEMAVAYPEDWHVMLVLQDFTASDLMAIGARFTRLVIAGMSLEAFSNAKMDAATLNIIRFNRHAFVAANGTKLQWDRIVQNAGENPFGYTWGIDSVFECCTNKK